MRSLILIAGFIAAGISIGFLAAQEIPLPNELVQYVKDAKKAGIKDDQIQKNAIVAGWPENTVKSAMLALGTPGVPAPGEEPRKDAPEGAATSAEKPRPAESPAVQPSFEVPSRRGAASGNDKEQPAPASAPTGPVASPKGSPTAPAAESAAPDVVHKPDRGASEDYVIGAGDVLTVSVWKEPDASTQGVVVRTDGKITMPLIKDVAVDGLTLRQAEAVITDRLTTFLTAPDVTVMVKEQTSKKIYIIGAVKKEGAIPFTFNMNVLQALSEAGGLTDYAKRKRIYVLRREEGREFQLKFDYDAAIKGQKMELNIPLRAGDTVVVPH